MVLSMKPRISTAFLPKEYPIVLVVFLLVVSAPGAGVGVGMGGEIDEAPSDGLPAGVPADAACEIQQVRDEQTIASQVETVAPGETWESNVALAANDELHVSLRNIAGIRPTLTITDQGTEAVVDGEYGPTVEETITSASDSRYTIEIENVDDSHEGLWEIEIVHHSVREAEVCP